MEEYSRGQQRPDNSDSYIMTEDSLSKQPKKPKSPVYQDPKSTHRASVSKQKSKILAKRDSVVTQEVI